MSERKLFGILSGTHLTIVICVALLAPAVVYGAVAFTPVAIVEPNSGARSYVDPARRVYVYDPIAGYANNPYFAVNINDSTSSISATHSIYTVPAGKAFVMKSITWSHFGSTAGNNTWVYITDVNGVRRFEFDTQLAHDSQSASFNTGIVFKAGPVNLKMNGTGSSYTFIQGYLIPETAIPVAGTAEASEQFATSSASADNRVSRQ